MWKVSSTEQKTKQGNYDILRLFLATASLHIAIFSSEMWEITCNWEKKVRIVRFKLAILRNKVAVLRNKVELQDINSQLQVIKSQLPHFIVYFMAETSFHTSVSHDPSKINQINRFSAQETFLMINFENSCWVIFCKLWKTEIHFRILWWIESSKEQHLSKCWIKIHFWSFAQ